MIIHTNTRKNNNNIIHKKMKESKTVWKFKIVGAVPSKISIVDWRPPFRLLTNHPHYQGQKCPHVWKAIDR